VKTGEGLADEEVKHEGGGVKDGENPVAGIWVGVGKEVGLEKDMARGVQELRASWVR
jgi:hypothetical protein